MNGLFVACAASRNFGMRGSGRLYVFDTETSKQVIALDTPDGLYDVAWMQPRYPRMITCASAGGLICIADLEKRCWVSQFRDHEAEVSSIDYDPM